MSAALRLCLLSFAVGCAASAPAVARPVDPARLDRAFESLRALAGRWDAVFAGRATPAGFEVVAGGTAVLQQSGYVAIYHRDFDSILVTVLTDDGNQPRLRARGFAPDGKTLEFVFVDATNLPAGAPHATGLRMEWRSADEVVQTWRWVAGGKETSFDVVLRRADRPR